MALPRVWHSTKRNWLHERRFSNQESRQKKDMKRRQAALKVQGAARVWLAQRRATGLRTKRLMAARASSVQALHTPLHERVSGRAAAVRQAERGLAELCLKAAWRGVVVRRGIRSQEDTREEEDRGQPVIEGWGWMDEAQSNILVCDKARRRMDAARAHASRKLRRQFREVREHAEGELDAYTEACVSIQSVMRAVSLTQSHASSRLLLERIGQTRSDLVKKLPRRLSMSPEKRTVAALASPLPRHWEPNGDSSRRRSIDCLDHAVA